MAMPVQRTAAAVCTVFLSIVMLLGAKGRAVADHCVERPDHAAPFGQKWYYRSDPEKNRKCWHLGAAAPFSILPPLRTETRAVTSTVRSVITPVVRGLGSLFRQPMPHERSPGEPRIVQPDATQPLTIDDIAQQPEFPEERAETLPTSPFTLAQRKALFEEYRRWEEIQRGAARAAPNLPRPRQNTYR
jgi:hypothetical protein